MRRVPARFHSRQHPLHHRWRHRRFFVGIESIPAEWSARRESRPVGTPTPKHLFNPRRLQQAVPPWFAKGS